MNDAMEKYVKVYCENIHRQGAIELLEWMQHNTQFFTAPAGMKHHGAYPGGLVQHSLNVHNRLHYFVEYEKLCESAANYLSESEEETCAIIGLLHDLCKHDVYHAKQLRDSETGELRQVTGYTYSDPFPFGHGEKSVYLINQFMKLTDEEALAIRWHMGAYDPAARGDDFRTLNEAEKRTNWVWYLHRADRDASRLDESEAAE